MTFVRCPYCKSTDLDFDGVYDTVIFDDEFNGSVRRHDLRCRTVECKGMLEGFDLQMDFRIRKKDWLYTDCNGEVLE